MGKFFIGSEYHDDMLGDDGNLLPGHRYRSKDELRKISETLKMRDDRIVSFEEVRITKKEYEYLKAQEKKLLKIEEFLYSGR